MSDEEYLPSNSTATPRPSQATPLPEGNLIAGSDSALNSPSLKGCPEGGVVVMDPPLKGCPEGGVVAMDAFGAGIPLLRGVPSGRGVVRGVPNGRGVVRGVPNGRGVVQWGQLPYNPKLKERAKKLRKAGNLAEVLFWQCVKKKQLLGLDFDRQKVIGNYIVDFYCKKLGLIIEIDGSSHDHKVEYDRRRNEFLMGLGLKMIHISAKDVLQDLSGVMRFLKGKLSP